MCAELNVSFFPLAVALHQFCNNNRRMIATCTSENVNVALKVCSHLTIGLLSV